MVLHPCRDHARLATVCGSRLRRGGAPAGQPCRSVRLSVASSQPPWRECRPHVPHASLSLQSIRAERTLAPQRRVGKTGSCGAGLAVVTADPTSRAEGMSRRHRWTDLTDALVRATQPFRPRAPHGEHEPVAVAKRPRRIEGCQRPAGERNRVLALRLHPRGRDRPEYRPDLIPRRLPLSDRESTGPYELSANRSA